VLETGTIMPLSTTEALTNTFGAATVITTKREIARKVMDRVTKLGGRFLLPSQELKGAWESANESRVLEDVISLMKCPLNMVSPSKRVCHCDGSCDRAHGSG
jgi:hypothetical protein